MDESCVSGFRSSRTGSVPAEMWLVGSFLRGQRPQMTHALWGEELCCSGWKRTFTRTRFLLSAFVHNVPKTAALVLFCYITHSWSVSLWDFVWNAVENISQWKSEPSNSNYSRVEGLQGAQQAGLGPASTLCWYQRRQRWLDAALR